MSPADRSALEHWLDADAEHRWLLGRYRELSGQLDVQLGRSAPSAMARREAAQRRRKRTWRVALAIAAVMAVTLVVLSRPRRVDTRVAERHAAALPDGSRVELNAQTTLAVDFQSDERRVRLVRGEAWFSVTKDPARPFVVETPTGVVRVTGTMFNVRAAKSEEVEVTVLEGTVRLHATKNPAGEVAMTPGAQARMSHGKIAVRELPAGTVQDVVAWRHGQAIFEDTPLREAMERFSAYHVREIAVDAAVADLRLGGRYGLDDLDGVLKAIERVLPVRVMRTERTVRITADSLVTDKNSGR